MADAGSALMGVGSSAGENRAVDAATAAITSELLEDSIDGATGILLNITGGSELGLFEVNEAAEVIHSAADRNANIIFGAVLDESMGDEVRVTVIATGFDQAGRRSRRSSAGSSEPAPRAGRKDRTPRVGKKGDLEIGDDDLDIPAFLK